METPPKILVVDDEEGMRFVLTEALAREGYAFDTAVDGKSALEKLESGEFKIVLMDIKMPRLNGLLAMDEMKRLDPDLLVILMTAFGSHKVAVETIRKGAYDYFTKPFDLDEMRIVIKRAAEKARLRSEVRSLRRCLEEEAAPWVGKSPAMKTVLDRVRKVADSDATVLITGESGTGKDRVAQWIHRESRRREGPFLTVNFSAAAEGLVEDELFGHEKGAFTGAHQARTGKFEQARGGTLFLDDVGRMPPGVQGKILRALQEREVERIGGNGQVPVDLRFIAASGQDLSAAVEAGTFREDLFYRLHVVNITLPPLRERPEDIPELARLFLKTYAEKFKRPLPVLEKGALNLLLRHSWPGNVRELENVIQRAVVLASGSRLSTAELREALQARPAEDGEAPQNGGLRTRLSEIRSDVEKTLIEKALAEVKGRRGAAAQRLGISRKNLYNKMRKYGLG